ncbi:unnamed protein product, partial [Mesorhabditis belari]|uniref:Sodium leak channel NALCN n=1 Tax=Mesorhabditis belari TaxID=2138241 RepID=A0AAF3FF07_9BILA
MIPISLEKSPSRMEARKFHHHSSQTSSIYRTGISTVAKAAVLSSAMLARKNSSTRIGGTQFAPRESIAIISDMLTNTPKRPPNKDYLDNDYVENILKSACLLSLFTVCIHTPVTFGVWWLLSYLVWAIDGICVLLFSADIVARAIRDGIYRDRDSLLTHRWSQFDVFMLIAHWGSLVLHTYQLIGTHFPHLILPYYDWFGVIRSVRPFIIIRLLRLAVKFKLPKHRIEQLLKRSSQQVQNVTVFFVFFMAFYAIMGIQLFGRMDYHCVLKTTDPNNVTIADLAIPDTMCSKPGGGGYECPLPMVCMRLNMDAKTEGFYGMFNDFGASVFTVYLAASEEGWVYVLYDCMDSLPSHLAFIYFLTLIFFLAWLVKNVFIAVITETFAEIRVQFSEMWQKKEVTVDDGFKQKLEKTEDGWRLVRMDENLHVEGHRQKLQTFLRSMVFQCLVIVFVLLNAAVNASFVHKHDQSDVIRRENYWYIEIGFTILFNIECLAKIVCFGWRPFIKRGIFKFELILCIGSSLNLIKYFYERNYFTYFQAFRLLRLIKASPILEDFVWKIFSPGKKLGGLVIFTITFVIIASAISLQLFNSVPNLPYFHTFPQAFMSMFQIITQEGWTDFVVEVLRATPDGIVPFVAIYFVAYHLFVTLIVLSLFVAVILDNLEMDEELKRVKQLKAREATTEMRSTLPWRLRVFEKFPTRPQMVRMKRVDSEFPMPKVRDSFTHQFAVEHADPESPDLEIETTKCVFRLAAFKRKSYRMEPHVRHIGSTSMKASIANLLDYSDRTRQLVASSFHFLPRLSQSVHRRKDAIPFSKARQQPAKMFNHPHQSSFQSKYFEHFENGDLIRPSDSAPKKDAKQGEIDIRALQQKRQLAEITRNRIEEDMRENHPFFDRPLFMVGRASKMRDFCKKIVHAKYDQSEETSLGGAVKAQRRYKELHALVGLMPYLDWSMVLITVLSCVSMLFESPWPTNGSYLVMNNFYLQIADYLFVLCMTFELIVKIISNGLFFTPHAVVRDVGGVMTMFIYFTSVIFLFWMPESVEINSLAQMLMICRAMRPLRIYTLVPHIRRVVLEFFRGLKEILLVTILLIVLMFIFAVMSVQIVGGKLAACNDPNVTIRDNCTGVFEQKIFVTRMEVFGKNDESLHPKILVPRVWTNPRNFNFDHIGNAMLALFETLSYKGWNVIRDIVYIRHGPWAVIFIHIYVFIGCMIGLTLFVGVVIANYTENRGTALLTVDQRRWHDLKARLKMAQPLHVPPKPRESARVRNLFYEFTTGKVFDRIFNFLVVLNSATLIVPWNVEEEEERFNVLFAVTSLAAIINVLFAVEIVLKVVAFTGSGFWQSKRNRIDLFITALGLLWVISHFFIAVPQMNLSRNSDFRKFTYTGGYIVVILRFFTLAGRNSTLKMLMNTVVMSMFRSFFIITAMFLLVLFYAYTGVILFGMVKYGQAVSKHVNFRTGSEALVVLFRSITGEDWNDIMHDCMRSPPFCYWQEGINYWQTDCGNYYGAIIYFCSFYLIITYIVRNLLVAIIMENFSLFYSSEEDALLSYADIRNFQNVWNIVDFEQKRAIPVGRVKFLLRLLKGRLEVDPEKDRILFKHMCYEMERLHNGDDVSFHDVLYMLSYRSVDIRKSLQLEELLQREELEFIIEEEVAKQTIRTWLETCLRRIRNPKQKDSFVEMMAKYPNPNSAGIQSLSTVSDKSEMPKFRFGAQDGASSNGSEDGDEPKEPPIRKKAMKSRRSSIPDVFPTTTLFHEAARKLMATTGGGSEKKDRKKKESIIGQSAICGGAQGKEREGIGAMGETVQLLPRQRSHSEHKKSLIPKQLHLSVYDLPDVEEREEGLFSPPRTAEPAAEAFLWMSGALMENKLTGQPSPKFGESPMRAAQDVNEWWQSLIN